MHLSPRSGIVALLLAASTAACGGGGGDGTDASAAPPGTGPATTVPAPSTVPGTTVPPTNLTLRITDVRLLNSEESDNGLRVLLPAGVGTASVTLTGLPSPNRVISVCQTRELDRRMSGSACRTPTNGEAVTVALGAAATGVEIVQVGVTGPGPAGNSAALDDVTIRYAASSREVNARLPQVAAGERPTFALSPASVDGAYRATLAWAVIPVFGGSVGSGQLEVVTGGNVAKAQSGGPGVQLSGNLAPPTGDTAIRVQSVGEAALVTAKLSALLP